MCQVLANSAKPRYILVGLHGMNGNPSDFMSFASDVLRKADSKHIGMTVVLPYAFKEASANKRSSKSKKWDHGGFRWWDLVDEGIVGKIKGVVETVNGAPAELPDVCKEIQRIVDEACCVLKLPDSCVSVVGFSMGAMLTSDLLFSLRTPPLAAGILSGMEVYRWDHDVVMDAFDADMRRYRACVALLQAHSKSDLIVPYVAGTMMREHFRKLGFGRDVPYEFVEFHGAHVIDHDVLCQFKDFLFDAIEQGPAMPPRSLQGKCGIIPLVKKHW